MRAKSIVLAIAICAGLGLVAGRASAGIGFTDAPITSDLVDGFFGWSNDANEPISNFCEADVEDTSFFAGGEVIGSGTNAEVVTVLYHTQQTTSGSRNTAKASVKQGTFSTLQINFGAVQVGPVQIQKGSISASVNTNNGNSSMSASFKGDDVFALLNANQIGSLTTAFSGSKSVKFKANTSKNKASLTIKCKGNFD